MNKIIIALISLALIATPALACYGPDCDVPNDGSINTYFKGSGWNVWFNDATVVDERIDDDMIVENIWTMKGDVTVLQNIDIEDHHFDGTEVIVNKWATVDPAWKFSANVEKYVYWDDEGSVYRLATLHSTPDVISEVSVGADEGTFYDDIKYKGTVDVYESIGLNTNNICLPPERPDMPDMPICDWCKPR